MTPLMVAVQLNYENMVKILLKYNPNMTITSKDGNSLVHQCVNNKEVSIFHVFSY